MPCGSGQKQWSSEIKVGWKHTHSCRLTAAASIGGGMSFIKLLWNLRMILENIAFLSILLLTKLLQLWCIGFLLHIVVKRDEEFYYFLTAFI